MPLSSSSHVILKTGYEFRAKVFPNGSASIDVNMQNRQSISFQGELDIKEEK